jgi:hypothetical protein
MIVTALRAYHFLLPPALASKLASRPEIKNAPFGSTIMCYLAEREGLAAPIPKMRDLQINECRSLRSLPFSFFRLAQASLARLQNKNAR